MQNKKESESIFRKTWKTSFWSHFGPIPIWPENLKRGYFPKNQWVDFTILCYCNFPQNIENIPRIDFS